MVLQSTDESLPGLSRGAARETEENLEIHE